MQDVENEWLNKNKDVSDMVSGEDMSAPPIKDSSAGGAESSFDLAGRICAGMQLGGATPFRLPVGRQGRQGRQGLVALEHVPPIPPLFVQGSPPHSAQRAIVVGHVAFVVRTMDAGFELEPNLCGVR